MKARNLFLIALAALALLAAPTFAADKAAPKADANPAHGNQTHCPVMGGKIDSTSWTDIQGQRVYHCCPGCTKSLKANPNKYFEESSEKGVRYENIQTLCPVSYEPLGENTNYIDYEGRRVFLCCEKCETSFNKDPQKYLDRLDELNTDEAQEKKAKSGHEGHGHMSHGGH